MSLGLELPVFEVEEVVRKESEDFDDEVMLDDEAWREVDCKEVSDLAFAASMICLLSFLLALMTS